jgi:AraC-like DNA-binding protein
LLTTDDSILQIAHASGFDTLSRFNRAFKGAAGMTPREYRKQKRWITPIVHAGCRAQSRPEAAAKSA